MIILALYLQLKVKEACALSKIQAIDTLLVVMSMVIRTVSRVAVIVFKLENSIVKIALIVIRAGVHSYLKILMSLSQR